MGNQLYSCQIQQKLLQKILEKVFVTKKCTNCKTSHTLKTDVFELPDNKDIRKLFSKYELFFPNQSNFSSNSFQILILQHLIPWVSLPSFLSLLNFTLVNWNPSSTQYSWCSSSFSPFFLPHSTTHHSYWMYQTKCQAKQIKFMKIIIPYWPRTIKKLSF